MMIDWVDSDCRPSTGKKALDRSRSKETLKNLHETSKIFDVFRTPKSNISFSSPVDLAAFGVFVKTKNTTAAIGPMKIARVFLYLFFSDENFLAIQTTKQRYKHTKKHKKSSKLGFQLPEINNHKPPQSKQTTPPHRSLCWINQIAPNSCKTKNLHQWERNRDFRACSFWSFFVLSFFYSDFESDSFPSSSSSLESNK